MPRGIWLLLLALPCLGACGPAGPDDEDPQPIGRMLIVYADGLDAAAGDYADYRGQTGYLVTLVATGELAGETLEAGLYERIRDFAEAGPGDLPPFVLLMGDADLSAPEDPALVPITVGRGDQGGYSWQEHGDTPYADLDADGIPDLAIGRLPFRSVEQVRAYLERVRTHEQTYVPGPHNRTLHAFAGEGGFGPEIDGMLELAAGWIFDEMSYDFDMSMTYASPNSTYYLPPAQWEAEFARRYTEGAVLMPYIGHTLGAVTCCQDAPPARRGLLAFFACSDGAFQDGGPDSPHDSLAEQVLLREYGPVAALAATDISHPYGNAILPRELGHAVLDLHERTYGQVLLAAQDNMVHRIDGLRQSLDAAAAPYTDEPLEALVYSHIVMYNLLGDPAVEVKLPPADVRLDTPGPLTPGQPLTVTGMVRGDAEHGAPTDGQIDITLEVTRSAICHELIDRPPEDHDPDTCTHNHAAANDKVVTRASGSVSGGSFSVQLDLPAELPEQRYYLKAFAWDEAVDAVGSLQVGVAE